MPTFLAQTAMSLLALTAHAPHRAGGPLRHSMVAGSNPAGPIPRVRVALNAAASSDPLRTSLSAPSPGWLVEGDGPDYGVVRAP